MDPNAKRRRWVIVAGGLAVVSAIAGFMILARPGDTHQTAEPVLPERTPAEPRAPVPEPPVPASEPAGGNDALWIPRYDFALEVDGKPSPDACFYQESRSRRILINTPEVAKICILNQEGKQVTAVDRGKVALAADGEQVRLLPGAEKGGDGSPYTVDQSSVVFYMGSNRLKITAKQRLVGPATPDDILRHSPFYRKGMQEYLPSEADIAYLRSYPDSIEIEVFFGTWCPHCKVIVPKFMKAVAAASNPNLRVTYHGVPTGFDGYEPARGKSVVGIPTFIFWKNGKEVGRIPGDPGNDTIEHAVAVVLRGVRT